VRHVAISLITVEKTLQILSKCSSTVGLVLFQMTPTHDLLPPIAAMPLQRLSADLHAIFGSSDIDSRHPVFAQLTHLDIFDASPPTTWAVRFAHLPRLTHLSLNWPADAAFFQGTLLQSTRLEILALLFSEEYNLQNVSGSTSILPTIRGPG
ncbi:hypothetical protein DFH09DRAFT_1392870, partial [Mycena vulgaris]